MVAMKDTTPEDEIEFIRQAAPNAKYVMSVCGGAAILAMAGVLEGKRATTNKSMFKMIVVSPQLWLKFCQAESVPGDVWERKEHHVGP